MNDQHQSHEVADDLSPTRRSFYIKFIYGIMTAIGAALAAPAAIYLLFPPKIPKEGQRGRLESHQRKSHSLGFEEAGQPGDRVRAAMHAPGLRLSLGRSQPHVH